MGWIEFKKDKPKKWSKVKCIHDNGICENALYQFSDRFLDLGEVIGVDQLSGVWRKRLFNVTKWKYNK